MESLSIGVLNAGTTSEEYSNMDVPVAWEQNKGMLAIRLLRTI